MKEKTEIGRISEKTIQHFLVFNINIKRKTISTAKIVWTILKLLAPLDNTVFFLISRCRITGFNFVWLKKISEDNTAENLHFQESVILDLVITSNFGNLHVFFIILRNKEKNTKRSWLFAFEFPTQCFFFISCLLERLSYLILK